MSPRVVLLAAALIGGVLVWRALARLRTAMAERAAVIERTTR